MPARTCCVDGCTSDAIAILKTFALCDKHSDECIEYARSLSKRIQDLFVPAGSEFVGPLIRLQANKRSRDSRRRSKQSSG